jgi:membrane protein YqaA with SNARE-associated domain
MLHCWASVAAAQLGAGAKPGLIRSTRHWLYSLGGLGFLPLGLLDASIVPIPGSMDVLTIVLCARRPELWIYYAFMATLGSVLGAWTTYRLARRGGKEMLERRLPKRNLDKVTRMFARWGFGAIAVPAALPPPVPMLPFVLAAGAMQYPSKAFLAAIAVGRAVRFALLAFLAERYGRGIITFVTTHGDPALIALGVVIVMGALAFAVVRELKKPARRQRAVRMKRA